MLRDLKDQVESLAKRPGVYSFQNKNGEIIYVGKSINVYQRVLSHIRAVGTKSQDITRQATKISAIPVFSELEALLLEAELIKKHLPKYNSAAKDDKHPLYIKITPGEFPKVTVSRRGDQKGAKYFGPFPASSNVKQVLKQIRRVFPYCSQKRLGKRGCFYSHINLCNPCPNEINQVKDPEQKLRLTLQYKSNIRKIVTLLSGKTKRLEKQLLGDMKAAVLSENFEKAAEIRDQLRRIAYVTKPYEKPKAYLENPNLVSDIREQELRTLQAILSTYYPPRKRQGSVSGLLSLVTIHRIECYDVAHTGGQATTCSMVTFIDGEPEKDLYRRFKIKRVKIIDDYASLKEALSRRLTHLEDWGKPDLIVIDGGKGQVSAALEVLQHSRSVKPKHFGSESIPTHQDIPVIGLAKRLEEIIVRLPDGTFKSLVLGTRNPATQLLQRLRNEAHRFARVYHFKLRLKELLPRS